ncbi:hypothetical protein ACFYVR_18570 [Rhodococcus sp. NPDC003318]|uniref:hypothetical protein n=1 Tax=Rhodococcus sp. NPDC003318 TaxID=3364503 RepID=UPI0036B1EB90
MIAKFEIAGQAPGHQVVRLGDSSAQRTVLLRAGTIGAFRGGAVTYRMGGDADPRCEGSDFDAVGDARK